MNSGGRDLSGNKRTNKDQSFDQKFDKMNEALRVSCKKGYPVRVVRYASLSFCEGENLTGFPANAINFDVHECEQVNYASYFADAGIINIMFVNFLEYLTFPYQ